MNKAHANKILSSNVNVYRFEKAEELVSSPPEFSLLTTSLADCKVFTTLSSHPDSKETFFPFLERHLERLLTSASTLEIKKAMPEHDRDFIREKVLDLASRWDSAAREDSPKRAMLRIVIDQKGLEFYLTSTAKPWLPKTFASLTHVKKERPLPEHKTSLLKTSKAAFHHAVESSHTEAILVDSNGMARECAWANLYWLEADGCLCSDFVDTLPGIIQSVLADNFAISKRQISFENIKSKAKAIFISNSTIGIQAVSEVDQQKIPCDERLLAELQTTLDKHARRE